MERIGIGWFRTLLAGGAYLWWCDEKKKKKKKTCLAPVGRSVAGRSQIAKCLEFGLFSRNSFVWVSWGSTSRGMYGRVGMGFSVQIVRQKAEVRYPWFSRSAYKCKHYLKVGYK